MKTKIFIVGIAEIDKMQLGKQIVKDSDELSIVPYFVTEESHVESYKYYIDQQTVNLSYKNNSLLYIKTNSELSEGITLDDYENNNIVCLDIDQFNMISDRMFINNDNILIIWLDKKNYKPLSKIEKIESEYFQERIDSFVIKYMYFLDEDFRYISKVILNYLYSNDEEYKQILLDENN